MSRRAPTLPPAVLLDLDDTLFDHALTCRAAIATVRRAHPYLRKRGLDEQWATYSALLEAAHPGVLAGRAASDDVRAARWTRLALDCGVRLSDGDARALSLEYRRHYLRLRRPVPGALALLERWHGRTRIVVVTNNEVAEQEEKLRYLGARSWVDRLVVSEAVGAVKPDPRIFEVALEEAGVAPAETVMIGDSWSADVLGALAVGIPAVWFNRFHRAKPTALEVPEIDRLRPIGALEALAARSAISRGPVARR